MIETLIQPFQFEFMRSAVLISVLVAIPAALLSCYLILKGWSLMGDAVSHAVLPGVVIAYIAGLPLAVGAFAAGMICALAAGYLKENSRIKQDTVMGVVFSGMFGLGIVLYTWIQSDVHLDHILFGDMLGVGWGDIAETALDSMAMARALIHDPELLLMDEPFGALDALTREVMQAEILRIWAETHKTVMFVTHSIDEAVLLSDRVIVMSARPSKVAEDLTIDLPRPRTPASRSLPRFQEYAQHLRKLLGVGA